ncbi:hypothetical protein [Streptomyces sp. NPDC002913]
MTLLNWRTATTLVLHENLIPDPNAEHNLLGRLQNVRVAIDGSFLHIDPRQPHDPGFAMDTDYNVHVVPATAVKVIAYRTTAPQGASAAVV